jgi:hypothetical protein
MAGGFRDSSIRLNAELRDLDSWTESVGAHVIPRAFAHVIPQVPVGLACVS